METAMDACMATAGTGTDSVSVSQRETCINTNAKAGLEASLGVSVDDQTLKEYLFASAGEALYKEMDTCTEYATTQAELDVCKNTNGKAQLASSLGLALGEVDDQLLNEYMVDAARDAIEESVSSCMSVASSSSERKFCVTGNSAKSVLAKTLGVLEANLADGELQEYVVDAAVSNTLAIIDKCMVAISTALDATDTAAAKLACRSTTGCTTLATALGLERSELSDGECYAHLEAAAANQINAKMDSCIAAISSALSTADQKVARGSCKTVTAKAGLATILGKNVADISTEELQGHVLNSALTTTLPDMMSACMSGASDAAARTTCRTASAKTAYASALGLAEDEITSVELEEALNYAARAATTSAMKACSELTTSAEITNCKASAKTKAAAAMGLESINALEFVQLTDGGAYSEITAQAKACDEAGTSATACDFQSKFDSAASIDSSTLSTEVKATASHSKGREAAVDLLKQTINSCYQSTDSSGGTRSATEIAACSKVSENSTLVNLLENSTRLDTILRDAVRELAAERMYACMRQDGATTSACETQALTLMQAFSTETLTTSDLTDALFMSLTAIYSSVYGTVGGVGCDSTDKSTCTSTAAALATSYGGSSNSYAIDISFNALAQAGQTWCSCEDVQGAGASDCEVQAKAQYVQLGGNSAEWDSTVSAQARDVATALNSGTATTIYRPQATDIQFGLTTVCSDLDTTAADTTFLAYIASVDTALTGYSLADPWEDTTTSCQMKYRVELGSSTMTLAALTSTLQAYSLTVSSSSRRSDTTASTSTSDTAILCAAVCSITSPTSAPTSAPTIAPTSASARITYIEYHITGGTSGLSVHDFDTETAKGTAFRSAAIDAFYEAQAQITNSSTISLSVHGSTDVELVFAVSGGIVLDITTLNSAILNTGSSGWESRFYTALTAAGYELNYPTLTFIKWWYTDSTTGASSDDFPVWVLFFAVFMLTVIGLAIGVFCWHRSKTAHQQAETKKIQKDTKDLESDSFASELEKTVSPGVPVTGATVDEVQHCQPRGSVDEAGTGASFIDSVQLEPKPAATPRGVRLPGVRLGPVA